MTGKLERLRYFCMNLSETQTDSGTPRVGDRLNESQSLVWINQRRPNRADEFALANMRTGIHDFRDVHPGDGPKKRLGSRRNNREAETFLGDQVSDR